MKYRNQGISPDHTLTIRLTQKEKASINTLHRELNAKSDTYISIGEIAREAIIRKIEKFNLKHKRLKKKKNKPYRISITATDKLLKNIKLATQESNETCISDFMRDAIIKHYKIFSKDSQ